MKNGLFKSLATLLVSSGLAVAPASAGDGSPTPAESAATRAMAPGSTTVEVITEKPAPDAPALTRTAPPVAEPADAPRERLPVSTGQGTQEGPAAQQKPAVIAPPTLTLDKTGPACDGLPDGCCPPPCCPGPRLWVSADALMWWMKHGQVPPLVTTGSATNALPGALGQPGTRILLGGGLDNEERLGGRIRAGYWLCDDHSLSLEGGFFFLGTRTPRFFDAAPAGQVLARPFVGVAPFGETASVVSFPGLSTGSVTTSLRNEFWGAEANLGLEVLHCPAHRLRLLGGFRYLQLNETLGIAATESFLTGAGAFAGSGVATADTFEARNTFYGGQLGAEAQFCKGKWSLDLLAKAALGVNHETVGINGSTTLTSIVSTATINSGLLALPSNIGRYHRDQFAVVPEAGLTLGYQVTKHLRATVGYTLLYSSNVVRPGDQIDRTLNLTQVPPIIGRPTIVGPARPVFNFRDTDFWAQGVNVGLEFKF